MTNNNESSPLLPQQGGEQTAYDDVRTLVQGMFRNHVGIGSQGADIIYGWNGALSQLLDYLRSRTPAAVLPQEGAPRLSAVQIDSIRNTVMIQLATENAGVIGGADVEDMQFPKRFAEAIMTALGSPVPCCGVCGDTGKWLAGYTGLFGGSVPVYETCKCAAKGNLYVGLANGDEWAQDAAAKFILGEAKAAHSYDMVLIERGYLAAACGALRHPDRPNDKVLEKLREAAMRPAAPAIEGEAKAVAPEGYKLVKLPPKPECCDEGKDGSGKCCGNGACAYLQEQADAAPVVLALPGAALDATDFASSGLNASMPVAEKDADVYCKACGGYGTISTGIAEWSSTLCYKCNGTGLQGEKP